jgi:hypothetical protein
MANLGNTTTKPLRNAVASPIRTPTKAIYPTQTGGPSPSYGVNGVVGNTSSSYLLGDQGGLNGLTSVMPNTQAVTNTMPQYEVSNQRLSDLTAAGGTPTGVEPDAWGFGGIGSNLGLGLGTINAITGGLGAFAQLEGVKAQKEANAENRQSNIHNYNLSATGLNAQIERSNRIADRVARANADNPDYKPAAHIATVAKRG